MRRKALVLGIVLALVVVSLPLVLVLNGALKNESAVTPPELEVPAPELVITVNGREVYRGPDPPTSNFLKMLAVAIAAQRDITLTNYGGQPVTLTKSVLTGSDDYCFTDMPFSDASRATLCGYATCPLYYYISFWGHAYNGFITKVIESLSIALGDGSGSFYRDAHSLYHEILRVGAGTSYAYNSTHTWFDISTSFVANGSMNIREVGVILRLRDPRLKNCIPITCHPYDDILILYTPLPSAVALNKDDAVVIRYRFYFTKPFTVQMVKWLRVWLPPTLDYDQPIRESINATDVTTTVKYHAVEFRSTNPSSQATYNDRSVVAGFFLEGTDPSRQVYLAYGSGSNGWSVWDRDVYSPIGITPLISAEASGNSLIMIFRIHNSNPLTSMHITELALQVNTTDANGVWHRVTLARWTVDYTLPPLQDVYISVRIAVP